MKDYDVILTICHVEANSPEEAISKAKADPAAVYNAIGEAEEIK